MIIPLEHPASLNALEQYRQACTILKKTSRATRLAWYREALVLEYQVHIVVDGQSIRTFFYDRANNSWSAGLPVSEETFQDLEKIHALGRAWVKQVRDLKGRHIGVVVHVADEFATAELKPKLNNPAALNDLRQLAYEDPREVLEDTSMSVEQASWRVIPYPAAGSPVIGTTISLSRRLDFFVTALRELGNDDNFPIITHVLSAPMVAIMGLPNLIEPSSNKPFVAVLQYPWFTAMAFFNEHSDLRLIRSLQHRGQRCPSNFWSSLATTNASLEFIDPDIYLLPLGEDVDTKIAEDLKRNFPHSKIESVSFPESSPLPIWHPEPPLSVADTEIDAEQQKLLSHTFGVLRSERWFLQDFLSPSKEAQGLFPTRNEIRLLRTLRIAKKILIVAVILWVGLVAMDVFKVMRRPEWKFNESEAQAVRQRMTMLGYENKRLEHWNSLLEDRSKAWSSMEMVAQMFPEKSKLMLKNFSHTIRPDSAPGQAKIGFIKEWKFTGLARDEARTYLNRLNTRDGITEKFAEISKLTGDMGFDPTPTTRSLVVDLRTQEHPGFRQMPQEDVQDFDPVTYPFTFDLTITQRFESSDMLAIPAAQAP